MNQLLERVKSGNTIDNHDTVRKRKDGNLVNVSISASPIYGDNQQIAGVAIIARDVSKLKESEVKMKEYTKELERFNKIMVDREMKMIELKPLPR